MRRALILLFVLPLFVLAACGGGASDNGSADARKLVEETFSTTKPLHSGKLTLAASVTPHGLQTDPGTIKIGFAGPFDRGQADTDVPKFDFTLSAELGGTTYTAGAASTGTAGFLSLQGTDYALPASEYASLKQSFEQLQSAAQPKTTQGQLDWLKDPEVKGDADVAGVATTRVSGSVDVAGLLGEVSARQPPGQGLTPDQVKQAAGAIKDPTFEFYTGQDDHVLRRVTLGFTISVPEAAHSQLGGLSSADVTLDYQVAELNAPQTVTAPADPRPVSELAPKLQALQKALSAISSGSLGGATGGSGSSGSSGSSGGAAPSTSEQAQQYKQCLDAAGSDVAAQQQCGALLK